MITITGYIFWRHKLGTRNDLTTMTVIISRRHLAWMWSVPTHIMLEYCGRYFFFGPVKWKRLRYFLNSKGLFSWDDFYNRFWGRRIPKLDRLRDTRVRMSEHRDTYYTYILRTYIYTVHTYHTYMLNITELCKCYFLQIRRNFIIGNTTEFMQYSLITWR